MKTTDHRLKNLKAIPRSDDTTAPLAADILGVRVSTDIDAVVRSLPNRSAWLRRVITEAAQRELIKVPPAPSRRDGEGVKEPSEAQLKSLYRQSQWLTNIAFVPIHIVRLDERTGNLFILAGNE
jgi:hypothetical protein